MQKFTNLFLRRTTFILMVLCTICFSAAAQTSTVTGVVTAKEDNAPIPGVTVKIKNTQQGVATDANGKFSLNAPTGAVLVFNLVGYEPMEVAVNGPVVNVSLSARQNNLNEVVVIGYGTIKKKDLTGAVANIKGADIKSQGVSDVTKALQGVNCRG
jgi:hypothetical protein